MTTADTFLVCWCLLTSSLWSVHASPSSMNSCKPFDFSGPSDVVFLIDRSESISNNSFEGYKKYIRYLVTEHMTIGPDDVTGNENYSRMGVITFAANVSIDLNLITDLQKVNSSDVLDRNVTYIAEQKDSKQKGLRDALRKAPELLLQRSWIDRKLLFIVSDFHEFLLHETKTELQNGTKQALQDLYHRLRNHTFKVFGVGGGPYLNLVNMSDLFDCPARCQEDCKVKAPDGDTSYPSHLIETDPCCQRCGESSCRCKDNPGSLFYPNGSICQQSSRRGKESDLDHTSPRPQTVQPPDDESQDPIIPHWASAVIVFMGGVILAMAIMAGVTKWRRKNTRPSADAVELSEPRAAGRSPLGPQPSIHLHLNIGSLSELRRPSPSPVRLPITGPSTQTMTSEFGAAAPEQPSAGGQSPSGPESSALPKVNTTWNRRQQHPSPPPVRTTARVPKGPPPLPQHPPPHPVRQPPTTLTSFDEWYPEQTSFDEWFPEQTSFDEGYVKPGKPPPHDRDMPDSYAHTLPGSVFLAGGNHSTQRESSHAYEDMVGPRTVPRRQTLIDILNQVNSVRRNLSIWFSQK